MKKVHIRLTFHENQEFNTKKNKSLKFIELYIMNLKIY